MKALLDQLAQGPLKVGRLNAPQTSFSRTQLAVICGLIFLMALSVRLLYWQDNYADFSRGEKSTGHLPLTFFYHRQARIMLDGGGILFPSNEVDTSDARMLTHPPGYSLLILSLFKVFHAEDSKTDLSRANSALRIVQIVGDSVASVVIFLIAAEFFSAGIAIIAALLSSFSPHFAYYSIMLSPDTLFVLPVLLAVYCLIRAARQPRLITMIAAGVLIGLACWLRPNALLLAPFLLIIIPLLIKRGTRLRYSLAILCGAGVMIAPIIVRNWIVFHRFIPISATTGLLLVEGIGDYDKERRFGMPVNDIEAVPKDVEWHGRPEYAESLWKPDGVERDQARLARGIAVIRSNPGWFLGVILRRMGFMLRYNDFRPQVLDNVTVAPVISAGPNFGHDLAVADEALPMWSRSSSELIASGSGATFEDDGATLQVTSEGSHDGDPFFSEPIAIKKNTDYLLRLTLGLDQGDADIKIGTTDPRIVLALVSAEYASIDRKQKSRDRGAVEFASTRQLPMRETLVPFASGDNAQVQLSVYKSTPERVVLRVGRTDLFESGPTPYLWTRYPRAAIRGIQKNFYKTSNARALIAAGILLLVLARRWRALAILLVVPVYFLVAQSPLHTEYRYILAIHYFLFVMAAVIIYYISALIGQGVSRGYPLLTRTRRAVC